MKKLSKYNRYITTGTKLYVYNLLSRALICIEDEFTKNCIQTKNVSELDIDTIDSLTINRFICEESIDEYLQIVRLQRIIKYGNRNARLTILPTFNCNFRCWYCYEEHNSRNLTQEESDVIVRFCLNLIETHKLNSLTLDWFGGEPMLKFDDIVVPLSLKIKNMCQERDVQFYNMITTNGVLIRESHVEDIKSIDLKKYQITLDGSKEFHNKTRFSNKHPNSYDAIIKNIILLINMIPDIDLTLRINCTPTNIDSITSIIDSFPVESRPSIKVNLQPVWQEVKSLRSFSAEISKITSDFCEKGFVVPSCSTLPSTPNICYVENMLHYTIAPGLEVYKCTARDFKKDSINYIGNINEEGLFVSNDNILNYYCNSFFENNMCRECEVLPVCRGNCIQKHIEKSALNCQKEDLIKGVDSILLMKINNLNK